MLNPNLKETFTRCVGLENMKCASLRRMSGPSDGQLMDNISTGLFQHSSTHF